LIGSLVAAFLVARGLEVRQGGFLPVGSTGVIVLDLSASVSEASNRRIAGVLRNAARSDQPTGLVSFSDTAYELLPPRTRGVELRPLLRYFEPRGLTRTERMQLRERSRFQFNEVFLDNPWEAEFRSGTRISSGLLLAREMLKREGIVDGSVLLVSDLDYSPADFSDLTQILLQYRTERIPLRIVGLFPSAEDRALFARMLGGNTIVEWNELKATIGPEAKAGFSGKLPVALLVIGVLAAVLLALNELRCGRLALPRGLRA
jgi:hypothetical protein